MTWGFSTRPALMVGMLVMYCSMVNLPQPLTESVQWKSIADLPSVSVYQLTDFQSMTVLVSSV